MTTVDFDPGITDAEQVARRSRMSLRAWSYLLLVVAVASASANDLLLHHGSDVTRRDWTVFAVLSAAAAIAQLFVVTTPRNQSYHAALVFLMAGALLLPPAVLPLMALVQHVPEWLKERYPWYIQSFNVSNYTLDLLAASGAAHLILHGRSATGNGAAVAAAWIAAAAALVAANHLLLATMLRLGRGHSWSETGLFGFDSLSIDLGLAALGLTLAATWKANPWLAGAAVVPLLLVHRSLAIPQLEQEARRDPKTGLFNARYFATALADELARAQRFDRPLSLIMADLDLLRDINNTYGHLAGDAVLQGLADEFRAQLRQQDVPARFGGEEFSILLPETTPEQALEIAERIRRSVAERVYDVATSSEPIRATVSIGVAGFPEDGTDANELIHQADLAVYHAKLQGRNRVLSAGAEPLLLRADRQTRLVAASSDGERLLALPAPAVLEPAQPRHSARPKTVHGPRFLQLSRGLATLVAVVAAGGVAAGALGLFFGYSKDVLGIVAVVLLVGGGQALALELDGASVSLSAVGALAGAVLFGPRAALVLALTSAAVEWSARRQALHHVMFNIGTLTFASLAAVGVFDLVDIAGHREILTLAGGLAAGFAYFLVNMGLVALATSIEGHERFVVVFKERFAWLLPHYVVYGLFGSAMALAYDAKGLLALAVFTVPLLIMRRTQDSYLKHTQRNAQKLRAAAETIQTQNVSLERANRLLRERSTAAMESLSATVDARDSYTAGHSRRVQQLALAIGRELGLSQVELDLLGHAALFHDIGKLAIPDAILLKPASLTDDEWPLMQRHAEEGARIIDRLGFLSDAVPAIRHHHERYDGSGYPHRLKGEDIPVGARIIHVADAFDSMLTTRIYRAAQPVDRALGEIRRHSGTQFCVRCVEALERAVSFDVVGADAANGPAGATENGDRRARHAHLLAAS